MVGFQAYTAEESACDRYEKVMAPLSGTLANRLVVGSTDGTIVTLSNVQPTASYRELFPRVRRLLEDCLDG